MLELEVVQDIWMVFQVVLLDLALGGDNAVIIGMAAKNLAPRLQKRAIIYGTVGAVLMRFVLAGIVVWLLEIPYLKTLGALILIYIGIKLIGGNQDEESHFKVASKSTLIGAVETIMVADAVMSLDNVLGIVGATNGHFGLLMMGMAISVPIIVFGSTIVIKIMDRFPWVIYVGGLILGWAAGGMVTADEYMPIPADYYLMVKIILTAAVVIGGFIWQQRGKRRTKE